MRKRSSIWLGALLLSAALAGGCGDDEETECTGNACNPADGGGGSNGGAPPNAGGGGNGDNGGNGGTPADGGAGGEGGRGGQGGEPPNEWIVPSCTSITGTDAVTFTKDEGDTLTPGPGELHGVGYTGLAALDTPNTLLAEHKGVLLESTDAGCSFQEIGNLEGGLFRITAAPGGRAYAWVDNGTAFYRIDDGVPTALTTPAEYIVGLAVDPKDGLHVRIGDAAGGAHDSVDGGVTWTKQGKRAPMGELSIGYRFAFDPQNLDHFAFGQSGLGTHVTSDGGETWTQSQGLGANGANSFSLVFSPTNSQLLWAESLEIGPDMRHVYRSEDGGLTFDSVVDDSATINLINQSLLVPHETDEDVLYFVYGTAFQGYGTDLYRYDHGTGNVTLTHNDHHDISSIAASPADPSVLYLGLVVEEASLTR